MADLKEDYLDDVLDVTKNTKRKYNMIQNEDGTVSFEDVTDYSQVGDSFGALDINKTNIAINLLKKLLGATNISELGDGTVTGILDELNSDLSDHETNKSNPHYVTKSQVGLGNVPNVATNDQTPTYTESSSDSIPTSGEKLSVAFGKIARAVRTLHSHITNKSNPHNVTASQVGLIWNGEWAQNIDAAPGNYLSGAYWVTAIKTDSRYVEGTHAFPNNFYYLFIFPSYKGVQFAVEYNTGRTKSRCYVNNVWQSWTKETSITDGGTGATTAAGALSNIASTLGNITSPTYLLSLGSGGYAAGGGYTTPAQLKTAMALNNVNNTADSAKSVNFSQSTGRLYSSTIDAFVSLNSYNNLKPYVWSTGADNDNKITLGSSTARYKQLHAGTATIATSDRNLKDNIKPLTDIHKQLFMKLIPVSFTFKDGESGRTHVGFVSQDVEQAMTELGMTDLDFAGFCKDVKTVVEYSYEDILDENGNVVLDEDGEPKQKQIERDVPLFDEDGNPIYIYSLRYSEFIGIIAYVLQLTVNELEDTKNEIANIKQRLDKIGA